jgi:nitrogen regulatory protein PII 1
VPLIIINQTDPKNNLKTKFMLLIRAIVRPEKSAVVLKALFDAGFPAVTKMPVFGRGKQRGLKVGTVTYDELPKELMLIAIKDADKDFVVNTIIDAARTGEKGAFGDGKIFVTPIVETYTISNGLKEV